MLSATAHAALYDFTIHTEADALTVEPMMSPAEVAKMVGLDHVAASYGFSGAGQTVAIIDTGIAYDHIAISDGIGAGHRVVGGYDFAENDAAPYDDGPAGSHGTHVAGIISSTDARAAGIASGADIVALRVFNDQGNGFFSWVEEALQWVHVHRNDFENPITTVNLSLGVAYNGKSVPDWATLENEFAQLQADGIFISVAAGNGFINDPTQGLSYPAVSPYVVPVSSVDPSGSLSYYSQRDDRVIAAPGRAILSTVPDYIGNHNGVNDDFISYSGTSMAAPLVAGASMLLREAYQFAGITNVNEQALYNTMLVTADSIYDAITGTSYHRLNIDRAIASILPSDDFGSTAATSKNLGTLAGTLSVQGTIGQLNDSDWFSFTAAESGTATFTFSASANLSAKWLFASTPADAKISGNTVVFKVVGGQTYALGVSTDQNLTHYSLDVSFKAAMKAIPQSSIVQVGSQLQILGTTSNDVVLLTVADAYQLTFNGVSYRFDAQSVNAIAFNGNGGNDAITIRIERGGVSATLRPGTLDIVGSTFQIHTNNVASATLRGNAASSKAMLYDSNGDDTFVASPTASELRGPGYVNRVEGFSSVCANASLGHDVASLSDSAGNDTLSTRPTDTTLAGRGFSNRVRYFDEVHADSNAGGYDIATLYDQFGNMRLSASGKNASLVYERCAIADANDQPESAVLVGFQRVRVVSSGGTVLRPQLAAIDFLLDLLGRES
jgi:subtilisin family serine protease